MIDGTIFDFECESNEECKSKLVEIVALLRKTIDSRDNYECIPKFSVRGSKLGKIPNDSLVRYKCLVSDACISETYVCSRVVAGSVRCFGYRDVVFGRHQNAEDIYGDRFIYLVKSIDYKPIQGSMQVTSDSVSGMDGSRQKRKLSDPNEMITTATSEQEPIIGCEISKQLCNLDINTDHSSLDIFNCHSDCLLKLYEISSVSMPKIGDVIEVIGIYRHESSFDDIEEEEEEECDEQQQFKQPRPDLNLSDLVVNDDDDDDVSKYPPSSILPRIHCLLWRIMPKIEEDANSIINNFIAKSDSLSWQPVDQEVSRSVEIDAACELQSVIDHAPFASLNQAVCSFRNQSIRYISSCCSIDLHSAELILICCLSRVQKRCDDLPIGHLVLYLTGLSPDQGFSLHKCLKQLFLHCSRFCLTDLLDSDHSLAAYMNQRNGRLIESPFQLSPHTIVIVDECKFSSFQSDSRIIDSLSAVQSVVVNQCLNVKCSGIIDCCAKILTDLPVVIVSSDETIDNSVLFSGLGPVSACFAECISVVNCRNYLEPEEFMEHELMCMQAYVSLARHTKPDIDNDIVSSISKHYADQRQTGLVCKQDLSRWLTLTSLVAASFCVPIVTMDHWKIAKQLECNH